MIGLLHAHLYGAEHHRIAEQIGRGMHTVGDKRLRMPDHAYQHFDQGQRQIHQRTDNRRPALGAEVRTRLAVRGSRMHVGTRHGDIIASGVVRRALAGARRHAAIQSELRSSVGYSPRPGTFALRIASRP